MQLTTARWAGIGAVAGASAALASLLVFSALVAGDLNRIVPGFLLYFIAAAGAGAAYGWLASVSREPLTPGDSVVIGTIYGVAIWIVFGIVITPVLAGMRPQWSAPDAATQFPLLILCVLQGLFLVAGIQALLRLGVLKFPAPVAPSVAMVDERSVWRIVVLGGGFAGVTTAQKLEKLVGEDQRVEITLVSRTNHLLFTPMLAEVTAGGVEAQHICPPLRAFFKRVHVIKGEPFALNTDEQSVAVRSGALETQTLRYDHLVLALGAVPNFYGNANIERHAFTFKSLSDAIHIRNHIIDILEQADSEPDADRRRRLLTFIVVGAGFAGSELIGGLNDFVRGSLWYYKHLKNEDIKMLLVHPGARILPELSEELAHHAEVKMTARGVTILGNRYAKDANAESVTISEDIVPTATLIWTAGNVPHPLLHTWGFETDKRGAVITTETLLVKDHACIWAVGDCAAIPDTITGKNAPPTAQYALREAKALAHNLYAALEGQAPQPFAHRSQGALAVVGHQTAVAEVFGLKISGLFAWLMWRGIYLTKLPTLEKKVRVLLDWIIDVFFPRDIAYAHLLEEGLEPSQQSGVLADGR